MGRHLKLIGLFRENARGLLIDHGLSACHLKDPRTTVFVEQYASQGADDGAGDDCLMNADMLLMMILVIF